MAIEYEFLDDKNLKREFRQVVEGLILFTQKELKDYFTFDFKLIGSGDNNLITISKNENDCFDLDYNLVIQRDKKNLIGNPKKIKELFMNAFNKINPNYDFSFSKNSTSVITAKLIFNNKLRFSFDCAIMCEFNDGFMYKIIFDKPNNNYIWNRVKNSKDYQYRLQQIKKDKLWNKLRDIYLFKKNNNKLNKPSFSLLLESINEIEQKYEI